MIQTGQPALDPEALWANPFPAPHPSFPAVPGGQWGLLHSSSSGGPSEWKEPGPQDPAKQWGSDTKFLPGFHPLTKLST